MTFLKLFSLFTIFAMAVNTMAYPGNYYDYSYAPCPNVEKISKEITEQYIRNDPTLAAGLIRMLFHDCAVRGCDASVLLDPTLLNSRPEKVAVPNLSLRGYEVVNAVKAELEKQCPNAVSCADVLSLVARDAIVAINGPWWAVPLGRRDGKDSFESEALAGLPSPFANITILIQKFVALGLTSKDLAVLSGAHSIGIGHCSIIQKRLYNFTGKGDTDPSINYSYAAYLKIKCPQSSDKNSVVDMDPITPKALDEKYYTIVAKNAGFFQSDAALLDDYTTNAYVQYQDKTKGSTFARDFAESMSKLIQVGILTGSQGEVRKTCGSVNPLI